MRSDVSARDAKDARRYSGSLSARAMPRSDLRFGWTVEVSASTTRASRPHGDHVLSIHSRV